MLAAPKDLYRAEWVELYNPGAYPIDLGGWLIDDSADGGGQAIAEGSAIEPGGLLVVELQRAILNNSGDTVRLLAPDGRLVDSFAYLKAKADHSLSRSSAGWDEGTPSPGQPNTAPTEDTPEPALVETQVLPASSAVAPSGEAPRATTMLAETASPSTPTDKTFWQIGPGLRAGQISPAPTYAAPSAEALGASAPPAIPAETAPIGAISAAAEALPAPPQTLPLWPLAGAGAFFVTAIMLFVAERSPATPESEEDGVL